MSRAEYDGPALDGTYQHISESPRWSGEGETVDVVDDEEAGEIVAENVPVPDGGDRRKDLEGQTTLDDWGWSA